MLLWGEWIKVRMFTTLFEKKDSRFPLLCYSKTQVIVGLYDTKTAQNNLVLHLFFQVCHGEGRPCYSRS